MGLEPAMSLCLPCSFEYHAYLAAVPWDDGVSQQRNLNALPHGNVLIWGINLHLQSLLMGNLYICELIDSKVVQMQ